jgi:alpha-D-ribose 1-methylphosphonate 5-triphosphate synthase subunit PhnG
VAEKENRLNESPRTDWVRAWTAHAPKQVKQLAARLTAGWDTRVTRLPQAGLGLLTLADGAFNEPYYLGEFPLAACSVEIVAPDGARAEGGAQVMSDDADLARALAILDALMAARLAGCDQAAALLKSGARLRAQQDSRRRAMLAATKVDFALLSAAEDGDED